jgi:hypothetical protein
LLCALSSLNDTFRDWWISAFFACPFVRTRDRLVNLGKWYANLMAAGENTLCIGRSRSILTIFFARVCSSPRE